MNAVRTSPDQWISDLELITMAAKAAGERALSFFRKNPDVQWKNEGRSPVSEADYAANDILKEKLLTARPNYGWLSEETDDDEARLGCDTVFVVDPIDGTRAFIAGKEVWCVSVAVVHLGRPVAGVLFAPKDLEVAAELVGSVVYDREMRGRVLDGPRRRLQDFGPERIETRLVEMLEQL